MPGDGAVMNAWADAGAEVYLCVCTDGSKGTWDAHADVAACARYFEFYGGACDKLHGDTLPYPPGFAVLTWREPHGVTGHIIPWNYPLLMAAWKLAPGVLFPAS